MRPALLLRLALAGLTLLATARLSSTGPPPSAAAPEATVRVAVIGDYGTNDANEAAVAALVAGWSPDLVLTVGDNNYPDGEASTIDANIGQYYSAFIAPYTGSYGVGAEENRFFPVLGNNDWDTPNAQPYLDYFALPGNERYYDFTWGPLHLYAIDSDPHEPEGITVTSTQALWLQAALAGSASPWNLVYMHHPPYSSGAGGSIETLQWPFAEWGAAVVLAGHEHFYERIQREGVLYFVNGSGGAALTDGGPPIAGSQKFYAAQHGAMLIEASPTAITFQFVNVSGTVIDSYTLFKDFTPTHWNYLPQVWADAN